MPWRVDILEYERGWGSRVDDQEFFATQEEAATFVKKYNKPNHDKWNKTKSVPEWYMAASDPVYADEFEVLRSTAK